jgi:rhodanese-related sulfurtransferase
MTQEKISAHEFHRILNQNQDCVLIDVRTPGEFGASHIPGAKNLPLNSQAFKDFCAQNDCKNILLHCQSGKRSEQAAAQLKDSTHTVRELIGGLNAWKEAGFSLNTGKGSISIERQVRIAAGSLVLLGVILNLLGLTAFIYLSAFVGAGLVFAGLTDTCGMGMLLAKMPWNKLA